MPYLNAADCRILSGKYGLGVYAAHQQVIGSINVQMPPSVKE
jgi:hypothetical protein